jgi:hypothetical protein
MFNIKTLVMAAAVSAGIALAMPAAGQAMPASAPVKIQAVKDGNILDINHRRHWKRWAYYCGYSDDWRCYRHHHRRYARYYHYYDPYYEPYYGYYEPYPYYGYYPRYYGPGIGFSFRF